MRLICPSCDAQYEVPDNVIPAEGRDVQCSSCSERWFQEAAKADETDTTGVFKAADPVKPITAPKLSKPKTRWLDSSITDVLREEAEREQKARAGETETPSESVSDGIEESIASMTAGISARKADDPVADLQTDVTEAIETVVEEVEVEEEPDHSNLTNVDEIDASVKAAMHESGDEMVGAHWDEDDDRLERVKFRRGFMMAVLLAIALLGVHKFAPLISSQFPGASGVLSAYVNGVTTAQLSIVELGVRTADWLQ